MYRVLIFFIITLAPLGHAQSSLPACNGAFTSPCFAEYRFPNGERYVGEWAAEKFHGQGSYQMFTGDTYVGGFQYGKNHGQGTYTWVSGQRYVGQFVNGIKTGQGTYTWPNGNRYVGQWANDKNNGQGTLYYANGGKYVGAWRDGKQNGKGLYYKADGSISQDGIWQDDIFVQPANPPVPPPIYAMEESSRNEYKAPRPAPPKQNVTPARTEQVVESPQDVKRKKCLRLGLTPGSVDFGQCMQ